MTKPYTDEETQKTSRATYVGAEVGGFSFVQDVVSERNRKIRVRAFTGGYSARRRQMLAELPYQASEEETKLFSGHDTASALAVEGHYSETTGEWVETFRGFRRVHAYSGPGVGNYTSISELPPHESEGDMEARLHRQVDMKLLGKLGTQKMNLAQTSVEARETAKMLSSFINHLAMSFRDLRKGNIKHAAAWWGYDVPRRKSQSFNELYRRTDMNNHRSAAAVLTSGWLGIQYGVKPFLQDLDDAMRHLASNSSKPLKGRVKGSESGVTSYVATNANSGPEGLHISQRTFSSQITVTGSATFVVANDPVYELAQTGFTSPLLTAWEVIPYSFVVDQFIPIGGYLESRAATDGLMYWDGFRAVKKLTHTVETSHINLSTNTESRSSFGGSSHKLRSYNRWGVGAFPAPVIPSAVSMPAFFGMLINDCALLAAYSGRKGSAKTF